MAAFGASFESEKSIEEKKKARRSERELELQRAKDAYEKQEKLKEQKRLRGEDTWMLTDVNERLDQLAQDNSVKKKKKKEKHSKKAKKEKKQKSKKQKLEKNVESADSSSGSEDEWIESTSVTQSHGIQKAWKINKEQSGKDETPAPVQRDDWMTLDFMSMKTTSVASLRAEKQKEKELEQENLQAIEQANILSRELNPYWRDGGTGLPPEEGDAAPAKRAMLVEDGGLSWLQKSYQRMKEQSEKDKRNLNEIIAERYGSVETFEARMREAEKQASLRCRDTVDRRSDWRKCKYSDMDSREAGKREGNVNKIQREAEDGCKIPSNESPKNRSSDSSQGKEYKKHFEHRSRCDERDATKPSSSSEHKNYESRTAKGDDIDSKNRRERSSNVSGQKYKFLKPCDNNEFSYKHGGRNTERLKSSALPAQGPLSKGFRKPVYENEDVPARGSGNAKDTIAKEESHQESEPSQKKISTVQNSPKEKEHKPVGEHLLCSTDKRDLSPERNSSTSRHESEAESIHVLSEEEMNKLGAKLVKAELMGNMDLAAKLKAQLEKAREIRVSQTPRPSTATKKSEATGARLEEDNEVLLVRTDQSGRAWPVNVADTSETKGGRRRRQMVETHEGKERVRYFKDDDNQSLQDLVRKEKMGTAEDQNKLFMRMASKFMEKTDKEYYTLDDMFVSKTARKESAVKEEEREREQAIAEHRKLAARMEKCPYCFDNPELPKHLIVAIGKKVYMCLPNYLSLTDGHCLIAPLQHYHSATLLDEDIWEEIQIFRKALVKMFESKGLDCVFLETNIDTKKRFHMVYECIPMPKEVGDMAPIYFKKAIMESDEEWSMNKKLIDLSSRDVRKSVPKGLPYFCVDFGLQGGFAHIIEDRHKFPHYFGKEIIGGMLDLEPRVWRKAVRENFDDQRKKVLQFAQWWKPYDFTKES
ncbi:hypothetical protein NDU88_001852 [Pleurodeles waltl]|uniref:CWF19-like protein 2 n=1 Tax=Pleurodeles waltl TaxID=8319 RepID=A0AAV7NBX1_PLEWA|nr:hypothetical protein NDU88_001852 [Pleurodeles waltl]